MERSSPIPRIEVASYEEYRRFSHQSRTGQTGAEASADTRKLVEFARATRAGRKGVERGGGAASRLPRRETVNNEAGVAYRPKSRAALRLETFEARPGATEGPSDRGKVEPQGTGLGRHPATRRPAELITGAWCWWVFAKADLAARQRTHRRCRDDHDVEKRCRLCSGLETKRTKST